MENLTVQINTRITRAIQIREHTIHMQYKLREASTLAMAGETDWEEADRQEELRICYLHFEDRAFRLVFFLRRSKRVFFQDLGFLLYDAEWWKRKEQNRKEKGRHTFQNKHRYQVWFMQTSFRADYGRFTCDRCLRTFFHSPSKILLATETVYPCACGYCTNELISRDWDNEPYS